MKSMHKRTSTYTLAIEDLCSETIADNLYSFKEHKFTFLESKRALISLKKKIAHLGQKLS